MKNEGKRTGSKGKIRVWIVIIAVVLMITSISLTAVTEAAQEEHAECSLCG